METTERLKTEKEIIYTPREAILHSASLLKSKISVAGTVVVLDRALCRMDISHGGAKMIVRLPSDETFNDELLKLQKAMEGNEAVQVQVDGTLRKEQRRTFLDAARITML